MSSTQNPPALHAANRGQFVKGCPGGPGRPRGSKNKKKIVLVEVRHVRVDAPVRERRRRPAGSAAKTVSSRFGRFTTGFHSVFSRFSRRFSLGLFSGATGAKP